MHKLTTGLKIVFTGVFFTVSVTFNPVFSQEEVTEETPEEIIEVVEEEPVPFRPAVLFADIPEELIADRMKCLEKDIKLTHNSKVQSFIDYFTIKNRKYLTVMESRKNLYFPIFEEYLKKHNMPDELKYLSIVESGLNPKAYSRAGAAGLWQFIPSTGKMYQLYQDAYIDERMDPYKATEAACKYLKQLYNMFNDWELALASYNCGPGNVRRAIRRSGYKETFWGIYNYLPAETRGYVPQFVAVVYVMNHLKEYRFVSDSLEYPMAFDTVIVKQSIHIDKFCDNLNVCKEDVLKLNPAIKRDIIPGHLNYSLRIPADKMQELNQNRVAIFDSSKVSDAAVVVYEEEIQPAKIHYKVKRGDYLGKIAQKYNVGVSDLKRWNRIKGSTVHVGETLVIYTKSKVPASVKEVPKSSHSSESATAKAEAKPEKTYYTVKPGDNLHKIAASNGVKVEELKKWNNINGSIIKVGEKLVIYNGTSNENVVIRTSPKVYYVQPGDTLWSISRKYNGISVEEIKKKNNLKDENIKPGMKLIIG